LALADHRLPVRAPKTTARTGKGEVITMMLREMDDLVTYAEQLRHGDGPIVLINKFNLAPGHAGHILEVWADGAVIMKQQPVFISTRVRRGAAGRFSSITGGVWAAARDLGRAFGSPGFQDRAAPSPASTVAAPHVFTKVAVPGICEA